ncbi:DUF397 domain-containing protein [Streptomyces sp. NPDC093586]|uniref:DUF397 domain-containing protein n=1 Tax=Streptomyces sp. NPDC093586 TaxID=3366042 RepID=UPI0038177F0F
MAHSDFDVNSARWRKSSHSNGDGGDCVEVAHGLPGLVPVRDSKQVRDGDDGPVLLFRPRAWQAFVDGCRAG